MYQLFANQALRPVFVAMLLFSGTNYVSAASLTMAEAEQLALKEDYTLRAISARSESMTELSVATEKLPDPQLKLGFANLPTDTFNLGQEPMTQAVIGLRQMFPRGHTRSLKSARITESVARNDANGQDRKQQLQLIVREQHLPASGT